VHQNVRFLTQLRPCLDHRIPNLLKHLPWLEPYFIIRQPSSLAESERLVRIEFDLQSRNEIPAHWTVTLWNEENGYFFRRFLSYFFTLSFCQESYEKLLET
jgi:hypothetical protein